MRGQLREALEIVDAGLRLDPDSRESLLLKSPILQALGRTNEAEAIAERAELLPESNWSERSATGGFSKPENQK